MTIEVRDGKVVGDSFADKIINAQVIKLCKELALAQHDEEDLIPHATTPLRNIGMTPFRRHLPRMACRPFAQISPSCSISTERLCPSSRPSKTSASD